MKKLSILIPTMLALVGFMATTVRAQNPHFLSCDVTGVNSNGTLSSDFRIAGLGSNVSITVTASADATATYGCLNGGQNCPNAANKSTVTGTVTAQGTFTSGKNGSVRGSLTVNPPPNTTLTCPGGQTLVLVSVSYTNVSLSAPGAGVCNTSPGNFAANFFPQCP
jgi:hypothetical protein